MKLIYLVAGANLFLAISAFAQEPAPWQLLFNGKDLSGWETYLDQPYATGDQANKLPPIGLNADSNHVFSVVAMDGKPALRISGETFGGINTLAEFGNYHLQFEFKWGTQKWPPRLDRPRDVACYITAWAHTARRCCGWSRSSFKFRRATVETTGVS